MFLLAITALLALQDPDPCRACEPLSIMASALSAGDPAKFLGQLDKKTPGYSDLEINVNALTNQDEILCSIDVLRESATDDRIEAEVDWYLQLRSRSETGPLERRRMIVKIIEEKQKHGGWKITSLSPLSILDPVQIKQ